MRKEEFGIASGDKRHTLHVIAWTPEGEIKAALQIVHGMVEFIDRYDGFARYLCGCGVAVIGHDHLGHGLTAGRDEDLGYFAKEGGEQLLIEDMYRVTEEMKKRWPGVPHCIMGHSMGSFCLRKYLTIYGKQVDGAIVMGTGDMPLPVITAGKLMAAAMMKTRGHRYRSAFLAKTAFSGYLKRIADPRTESDWLTRDETIVDAYRNNKYNTFLFTVSAFHDFFEIIEYDTKKIHLDRIPKDLPILITAGEEDPIGNWGEGPRAVYQLYQNQGFTQVEIKMYPEDRHEILNELDRETVYQDMAQWILEI